MTTKNKSMITRELIGNYKGKDVYQLTLVNKQGNTIKLSNFGARITWIEVPDRNGRKENVTFGYDTFDGMVNGDPYFGAVVGRYANRIAKGKFTLSGKEYSLALNNGPNSLHGGPGGWHSVVWDCPPSSEVTKYPTVCFTYHSQDMEEGYPGNMNTGVTYTWTDDNEIIIDYTCTTDKKTVLNITNHAYFNLHGAGNGDILDHELMIRAERFVAVDSTLIPTGELRHVEGTPFDFITPHKVGERIGAAYDQLKLGKGYDHTFVLNNDQPVDASVYDSSTGRLMEVMTDQPGVQFYCGNFLDGKAVGHGNKPYIFRSGLCLESGHYPDSPNHPDFPSTVLNQGDKFTSRTIYRFSVK
ncbi:MAG TPA: aldose epimerase family protein [Bacteroidales bacterium]|nr:aldose epimerase family protein [Bacteroidales bacterium]